MARTQNHCIHCDHDFLVDALLFLSRNAYKINKHINIVCRQQRTTENTLSDKQLKSVTLAGPTNLLINPILYASICLWKQVPLKSFHV